MENGAGYTRQMPRRSRSCQDLPDRRLLVALIPERL
jgi:hypothetical protein